jgi:phage N-6-adenine-methyltransferase
MSLVGFRAQNHPQQVKARQTGNDRRWHATEVADDRAITLDDFGPLHERFRFTIDAAAAPHNARLPRYWTRESNALEQPWRGERVWCNPPYSDIRPWIEKAWREFVEGGAELIVMLLPANRTEQRWWHDLVERERREGGLDVEFLPGRMRFLRPGQTEIGPNERPPFGCCLLIWGT